MSAETIQDTLPEWDLSDLYRGRDDPGIEADLAAAGDDAKALETSFKGKLARYDVYSANP